MPKLIDSLDLFKHFDIWNNLDPSILKNSIPFIQEKIEKILYKCLNIVINQ